MTRRKTVIRAIQGLLVLEVLAFTVSVLPGVRAVSGFDPLLDGWLQGSAYVVTAVLSLMRPRSSGADRLAWNLISAALVCRALAFAVALSVINRLDPVPYPSVADAGWLCCAVLLAVALIVMIRARFRYLSLAFTLDGVVGALATAAVSLALLSNTLTSLTGAGTVSTAVIVNLAYPALDVLLLIAVLGSSPGRDGNRPARSSSSRWALPVSPSWTASSSPSRPPEHSGPAPYCRHSPSLPGR